MDYNSFLELAKARRTIRRFRPDPIPDEYIDKIIEAARWAPSGFNMQPWEFVVVRDKKLKDAILQWVSDYHELFQKLEGVREPWQRVPRAPGRDQEMDHRTAPVFIVLLCDTRLVAGLPMMVRCDAERRRAVLISSMANTYLYMSLAATTLGLANKWLSAVSSPYPQYLIKDLLGIPPEMEVYDMMVLGYPAARPRTKLLRDKDRMVHYDRCGSEDFRTDEEVNAYIKRARTWNLAADRRGADKRMLG